MTDHENESGFLCPIDNNIPDHDSVAEVFALCLLIIDQKGLIRYLYNIIGF